MTIHPLPPLAGIGTTFRLVCDDCGRYRRLVDLSDLDHAIRAGWRRVVRERPLVGHWIAGHRCRKCAAAPRAVASILPFSRPIARMGGFDLTPGDAA